MIRRLLQMILGTVGVGVGLPFLILGLAGGEPVFVTLGLALCGLGALFLGLFALARRRERQWLASAARTRAEVVDARLNPHIRIGSMLAVDLTVRFRGGTHKRRVLLPPTLPLGPGDGLEVLYDPERPERFHPAVTFERRLR